MNSSNIPRNSELFKENINITNLYINVKLTDSFIYFLRKFRNLQVLEIREADAREVAYMSEYLSSCRLTHFGLITNDSEITSDSVQKLVNSIQELTTLKRLEMGSITLNHVIMNFSNNSLNHLCLKNTPLSTDNLNCIFSNFNTSIRYLSLANTNLYDRHINCIKKVLKNSRVVNKFQLLEFDLSYNKISSNEISFLIEIYGHFLNLESINLSNNMLSNQNMNKLFQFIGDNKLIKELNIGNNLFNENLLPELFEFMMFNKSIEKLNLDGLDQGDKFDELNQLSNNTTLRELSFENLKNITNKNVYTISNVLQYCNKNKIHSKF